MERQREPRHAIAHRLETLNGPGSGDDMAPVTPPTDFEQRAYERINVGAGMFVAGYLLGASCGAFVVYAIMLSW